jgi:hypothetical protein
MEALSSAAARVRCVASVTRLTWRGDRWSRLLHLVALAVGIIDSLALFYIIAKHERFHPNAPVNHN